MLAAITSACVTFFCFCDEFKASWQPQGVKVEKKGSTQVLAFQIYIIDVRH